MSSSASCKTAWRGLSARLLPHTPLTKATLEYSAPGGSESQGHVWSWLHPKHPPRNFYSSETLWPTTGPWKSQAKVKAPFGCWVPPPFLSEIIGAMSCHRKKNKPLTEPRETGRKCLLNVIRGHRVQKTSEPFPFTPPWTPYQWPYCGESPQLSILLFHLRN